MSMDGARRVALLGGSFDPPHFGHLAMARAARERMELDEILLAPTGLQPLKRNGATASFADRLAMTKLLCAEEPAYLRASAMDAPHADGSPNYTVETLEAMRREWPRVRLFAILGADSFREFPRWHEVERLQAMAEWIVVSRPGFAVGERTPGSERVYRIEDVAVPLASRLLRERLRQGEDCEGAVPASVLAYIHAHGLYRVLEGTTE